MYEKHSWNACVDCDSAWVGKCNKETQKRRTSAINRMGLVRLQVHYNIMNPRGYGTTLRKLKSPINACIFLIKHLPPKIFDKLQMFSSWMMLAWNCLARLRQRQQMKASSTHMTSENYWNYQTKLPESQPTPYFNLADPRSISKLDHFCSLHNIQVRLLV